MSKHTHNSTFILTILAFALVLATHHAERIEGTVSCSSFFNDISTGVKKNFVNENVRVNCKDANSAETDAQYVVSNEYNKFYVYVVNKSNKNAIENYQKSGMGLPVTTLTNEDQSIFMINVDGAQIVDLEALNGGVKLNAQILDNFLEQMRVMVGQGIYPSSSKSSKMFYINESKKMAFISYKQTISEDRGAVRYFVASVLKKITNSEVIKILPYAPRFKRIYSDLGFVAKHLPLDDVYFYSLKKLVALHADFLNMLTELNIKKNSKYVNEDELLASKELAELRNYYMELGHKMIDGIENDKLIIAEKMGVRLGEIDMLDVEEDRRMKEFGLTKEDTIKEVKELNDKKIKEIDEKINKLEEEKKAQIEKTNQKIAELRSQKETEKTELTDKIKAEHQDMADKAKLLAQTETLKNEKAALKAKGKAMGVMYGLDALKLDGKESSKIGDASKILL